MKQLSTFITKTRSKAGVICAALVGSLFSAAALAQSSTVGSSAASAITGAKPDMELVQTALLGALVLLVVFALIRRSFGK